MLKRIFCQPNEAVLILKIAFQSLSYIMSLDYTRLQPLYTG